MLVAGTRATVFCYSIIYCKFDGAAKAYFEYLQYYQVTYSALAAVSSNIFGLQMFNSGLTRYELKALSKIKVFGTIILENLPQLGCQVLYAYI